MCFIENGDIRDAPVVFRERMVRAKGRYLCCECGGLIEPADTYENATGKWDGVFSTFRTCNICVQIRNEFCCSWFYGSVWEAIIDSELDLGCLERLSHAAIIKLSDMIARHDGA